MPAKGRPPRPSAQKPLQWYYMTGHQLDDLCAALRFASRASLDTDWNARLDGLGDELRRQEGCAVTGTRPAGHLALCHGCGRKYDVLDQAALQLHHGCARASGADVSILRERLDRCQAQRDRAILDGAALLAHPHARPGRDA